MANKELCIITKLNHGGITDIIARKHFDPGEVEAWGDYMINQISDGTHKIECGLVDRDHAGLDFDIRVSGAQHAH